MKIEKLPSGSYRIRKTYKGIAYSVVTDYKPTQKEALRLMSNELEKAQLKKTRMTYGEAAEDYLEVKANVLSPATIRGYRTMINGATERFKATRLSELTAVDVQREVNRYAVNHCAKTVRNFHGFISAVLQVYAPNIALHTTLPQEIKEEPYILTDEDVRRILAAARGSMFESALTLAVFGLRRSEICALTMDDIGDGVIHVNKAKVAGADGAWHIKTTKTASSTRDVYVPTAVTDRIREVGLYSGYPDSIRRYLLQLQDDLGIPHFSLHKLRHYFASISHYLGVPDDYILAAGGWKSDSVLKRVYRHAMEDKNREAQAVVGEHIAAFLDADPDSAE